MLTQLVSILAWLALPASIIAMIDDWFLHPRRQVARKVAAEPRLITVIHHALPVLLIAATWRLLASERLDFNLLLVLVAAVAGLICLLDHFVFAQSRTRSARSASNDPAALSVPLTVDYARSFLPVVLIVLLVRSFTVEPFRIPSDSMMPTLLDGDFILVNKFAYGVRLPVLDTKIVPFGEPKRGDVVVFHYPPDPAINYIKRVVGLPGDHVRIVSDQLIINGLPIPLVDSGRFDDGCYHNMRLSTETLGTHKHQTLSCRTPYGIAALPTASCNRRIDRNYECHETTMPGLRDASDSDEVVVPPGQYLMIGDNRDNSGDSRYWGFVREKLLVGKAMQIWFNWDLHRSGGPNWKRIGQHIE
jgi:signal peptidase I